MGIIYIKREPRVSGQAVALLSVKFVRVVERPSLPTSVDSHIVKKEENKMDQCNSTSSTVETRKGKEQLLKKQELLSQPGIHF